MATNPLQESSFPGVFAKPGELPSDTDGKDTIPVIYGKYVRRVVLLVGVVGLLATSAPPSWAAPSDADTNIDSLTLALTDVGSASTVTFYGQESGQQLAVAVPHGLTPTALKATVELPINLRSGMITVTQADRTIARVDLPATDQAPITIPLAGAELIDNSMTVAVHAYLIPNDGSCFYLESPLRLVNGAVSYTGDEQPPTTVAHFLPPVLRKLTIFLPQSPSEHESDAAVHLATSVAAHYGSQTPEIDMIPLSGEDAAPPTPSRPLERQIVIKEGVGEGLSIKGATSTPWLLLSGPLGRTDASDTDLLFSDLSQLALAPKVVAGSLKSSPHLPGDTATLRELGRPSLNAVGLQPRASIGLDQTRFGRSIHSVRVHLLGSYSPTPANIGGQIVAKVGTETIGHWPTDGDGTIDHWVDVPDRLLQRYTNLDLVLDISGNTGRCGDFYTAGAGDRLLELTINGDTTIHSSTAAPPVPDGLQSVPQALMPRIQVGIEPHSFADTVRAVKLAVSLQRISSVPLDTAVTSTQQAIDSPSPAILIAADGWNHPDIVLPLVAGPTGPITINAFRPDGKPTTLALDPPLRFASLQTVFHHGRSLLIATSNGAPAQLDELLRWLEQNRTRWPSLTGVALVSAPGQDPVTVNHATGPGATAERHSDSGWLWWIGGGWLAVAVLGGGVIVLRSRRGSRRG